MRHSVRSHGFTLIELSIVLVIIGLIVGGILTGRDLIHAAEMRGTVRQVEEVKAAVQTFRLKYAAIPGDMRNATTYWGENDPDPVICSTTAREGTNTCNGNGDGIVMMMNAGAPGMPVTPSDERLLFWEHLSNARLIAQYIHGGNVASFAPPENVHLKAKMPNMYFSLYYPQFSLIVLGYLGYHQNPSLGHYLMLGGPFGEDGWTLGGVLSPMDAYAIDVKLDDGLPRTGQVFPPEIGANDCHDGVTNAYDVSGAAGSANCSLLIRPGF